MKVVMEGEIYNEINNYREKGYEEIADKILRVLLNENLFFTLKEKVHFNEGIRLWYKPKCITFIPLYLVFCYLLGVNWVNNIAFYDLGSKYGQRTKIMQKL